MFVLAFANDPADQAQYLAGLGEEHARLTALLTDTPPAGHAPRWDVVASPRTSLGSLLDLVQDQAIAGRAVALLHFAGHAGGDRLLMEGSAGPEVARAEGLAEFLKMHPGFGLVFLNACSTRGQVEALFEAGVPAVIATDFDVPDAVALEFSTRFYREFVAGRTLRTAYEAAVAAVQANDALRRVAQTRAVGGGGRARPAGEWPWALHIRPGNDQAAQWSLAEAIGDPLWGTPSPHLPLGPDGQPAYPESPYRHLDPFGADHVALFFGRRLETRQLHDAIVTRPAPVVLLHGVSGAGKSSLLEAGLLPRLERTGHVRYVRREATRALVETLAVQLGVDPALADDANALRAAWRAIEAAPVPGEDVAPGTARLTVILDQVEEAIAPDPTGALARAAGRASELERLAAVARGILDHPDAPRGALVLGFRKEWLAEVDAALGAVALPRTKLFLDRLSRRGIMEAVNGVAQLPELRAHYGLRIDEGTAGSLAEVIADDLLVDPDSPVAPTLQVLLSKMWAATTPGARVFSHALYEGLRKDGVLLNDFIEQQLARLAQRLPEASAKGLVLDVLGFHVSALGDASRARTRAQREARYPAERHALVEQIVTEAAEARLLATSTPAPGERVSRLGHDTLAPYLRQRLSTSVAPVQRGQRILDERGPEWEEGSTRRSTVVGAVDVAAIERAAWPWWRRGLDRAWRLAKWTVSAPWRWTVAIARGPAAMWRGTVRRYVWLRNLLSANSREGTDDAGHRWLDANDLRLVEAGLAWGRVPTRAEMRLLEASRAARARALRLRRQVVGGFGLVAVALALLLGQAWRAGERARLRGVMGWLQHERTDNWTKRKLLEELSEDDEAPGAMQLVSNVLDGTAPDFEIHVERSLTDERDLLTGGALSDSGEVAIAWSATGVVRVLQASDAGVAWQFEAGQAVRDGDVSSRGRCIAVVTADGGLRLHDVSRRKVADSLPPVAAGMAVGVRFDERERRLLVTQRPGSLASFRLAVDACQLEDRTATMTWPLGGTAPPTRNVVTVLPDGRGLLIEGATNRPSLLIDQQGAVTSLDAVGLPLGSSAATRDLGRIAGVGGGVARMAQRTSDGTWKLEWEYEYAGARELTGTLSSNGEFLAFLPANSDSLVIFDMREGRERLVTYRADGALLTEARFLPDTALLVVAEVDGRLRVVDVRRDTSLATARTIPGLGTPVTQLVVSRDGRWLLDVSPLVARLHRTRAAAREGRFTLGLPGAAPGLMPIGPDRLLTVRRGSFVELDTGFAQLRSLSWPDSTVAFNWTTTPDGTLLAVAQGDTLSVHELRNGTDGLAIGPAIRRYAGVLAAVDSADNVLDLSPDGRQVALGFEKTLLLESGGRLVPHALPINGTLRAMSWMGNDTLLIGTSEGERLVWTITGTRALPRAPGAVQSLVGAPNRGFVVTGTSLAAATIEPIGTRKDQDSVVRWLNHARGKAFTIIVLSPDASLVATGASDGTVRVWKRDTGELLLTMRAGNAPVGDIRFDAKGEHLFAVTDRGALTRWPVTWRSLVRRAKAVTRKGCLNSDQRAQFLGEGLLRALWWSGWCES